MLRQTPRHKRAPPKASTQQGTLPQPEPPLQPMPSWPAQWPRLTGVQHKYLKRSLQARLQAPPQPSLAAAEQVQICARRQLAALGCSAWQGRHALPLMPVH